MTFAEDEVQQSYNAYYEVVTYPVAFVGEIAPGATKTVTFHVTVASDGTKLDSLSIQAQAAYIAAGNEVNGGTDVYKRQAGLCAFSPSGQTYRSLHKNAPRPTAILPRHAGVQAPACSALYWRPAMRQPWKDRPP